MIPVIYSSLPPLNACESGGLYQLTTTIQTLLNTPIVTTIPHIKNRISRKKNLRFPAIILRLHEKKAGK